MHLTHEVTGVRREEDVPDKRIQQILSGFFDAHSDVSSEAALTGGFSDVPTMSAPHGASSKWRISVAPSLKDGCILGWYYTSLPRLTPSMQELQIFRRPYSRLSTFCAFSLLTDILTGRYYFV